MTRNRELVAIYRELLRAVGKISKFGGGGGTRHFKGTLSMGALREKRYLFIDIKILGARTPSSSPVPTSLKLVDC